jgi:hypothetical protein
MPCVTPNRLARRSVSRSLHYGELSAPTRDKKGVPKMAKVLCMLYPDPESGYPPKYAREDIGTREILKAYFAPGGPFVTTT